jgi:hypothetical protein
MAIINGRGTVGIRSNVAVAPVAPAATIITSGLTLYLDAGNSSSYPGTGTVWTDISGNGNTGTLNGSVTYNSGNSGSLVFNGGYVECGSSFSFGTGPFTISVWFKQTNTDSNYSIVWSSGAGSNSYQGVLTANYSNAVTNYYAYGFRITDSSALVKNIWYNVILVGNGGANGSRNIKLYTNTNQVGLTYTSDYNFSDGRFLIGANRASLSEVMRGNISNVQIYNRALTASEILQNYDVLKTRFYPQVSDSDAQSFIYAANIQDTTQGNAINTLVTSLKSYGIWTKMKAIYPFVGGTAASHKFNLKDPRDLDAAFRLTFTAGWVHSSTGAKPNGASDYANTKFIPLNNLSITNGHISIYSRTTNTSSDIYGSSGVFINNDSTFAIIIRRGLDNAAGLSMYSDNYGLTVTNTNGQGFYLGNRETISKLSLYKNNNLIGTNLNTQINATLPSINVPFGAIYTPTRYYYDNKEIAFGSIGDGLTDTEASNFYTAVQAYQTTLGRQV